MMRVTVNRNCSRPGCRRLAVATLEFNYADQVAIVGPLQLPGNPHRWDLCAEHASRTSVPQGWQLVIKDQRTMEMEMTMGEDEEDESELLALAEAVQRAYEKADEAPEEPPTRLIRREEIPLPTGRHPARQNLPTRGPVRHLRVVDEN